MGKVFRTGKVVSGHVVAGKGVDIGPQGRKLGGHIPVVRHIKELVLQIVGGSGGHMAGLPLQGEVPVDGAEIHRQVAKLFGKALPGNHCQRKTAGEGFPEDGFVQLGIGRFGHAGSPFRK